MDATQAAELTAQLKPAVAIPHHYAFTGGAFGDRFMTKSDRDPEHYRQAASRLAPATKVHILEPGEPLAV